jgi:hypothetical protein
MALVVGVLCAALLGMESTSSANGNGDMAGASAVEIRVVPGLSFLGFLIGAPFGGLIGAFWGRSGVVGIIGAVLVCLTGGFAGLTLAALLGAQTRIIVSGNSTSVQHGAPMPILVVGGSLGLILGALAVWWLDYRRTGQQVPVGPALQQATGHDAKTLCR